MGAIDKPLPRLMCEKTLADALQSWLIFFCSAQSRRPPAGHSFRLPSAATIPGNSHSRAPRVAPCDSPRSACLHPPQAAAGSGASRREVWDASMDCRFAVGGAASGGALLPPPAGRSPSLTEGGLGCVYGLRVCGKRSRLRRGTPSTARRAVPLPHGGRFKLHEAVGVASARCFARSILPYLLQTNLTPAPPASSRSPAVRRIYAVPGPCRRAENRQGNASCYETKECLAGSEPPPYKVGWDWRS